MAENRVLAAVAYLLTILTGIIVYILAKDDKYARWHALQAIGLGVALIVLGAILSFLPLGIVSSLFGLVALIVILVMAFKAYQGEKIRIPMIAEFADKNA